MANHDSTKKAIRKVVKKTAVNKSRMTRIRTFQKKALLAMDSGVETSINSSFLKAQSEISRAVSCGILKKNAASRKISRLARKINFVQRAKGQ